MEWREVVEHPSLKDLPFKIETNAQGYITMIAAKNKHRRYQGRIVGWFERRAHDGQAFPECNIETSDATKIAGVAWASADFLKRNGKDEDPYREAPEVVIEVISPSDSKKEMKRKMTLFFEKGAREFWLCDDDGNMRFFNPSGELERSALFGEFPKRIDLD